ncbi:hypothetical protein T03_11119 [Trichinella britovi]|uniref:Uncharacterized protein n=1 Tax=Trichinella britovi TaxID=45882 RepID=A0A0V0YZW2_TRIBR|nr:hypothetical protein T03_11119 [Trichinella britovi]
MGACPGICREGNWKCLLRPTPDILPGNGSRRMARVNGRFFRCDWRSILATSRQRQAVSGYCCSERIVPARITSGHLLGRAKTPFS